MMFAVILVVIFLLHVSLLRLPYFWDEAGYYVPAARDFLLTGDLIPHSTLSNAHPPLMLVWLAVWWKCAGYAPLVTRSATLAVAAFSLVGLLRLAQRAANTEVAVASTLCTALYPVFFAQSSLAQVDMAAAGLTFWGLCAYLEDRPVAVAVWFSLAALAKETAIIAPVALAGWEVLRFFFRRGGGIHSVDPQGRVRLEVRRSAAEEDQKLTSGAKARPLSQRLNGTRELLPFPPGSSVERSSTARLLPLLCPLLPLILWYAFHYARTGYVFGNPEFFRYNVAATLHPVRFFLALALRLWQTFGYLHLWVLTLGMLLIMLLPPVKHDGVERQRIAIPVQMIFLVVVAAYVVAMALIGGAVLARYMLPAVPLVIIVGVSTLRRRLRYWPAACAVVGVAFITAWFWNPPYGFSPEDNLAYRDYIILHQNAVHFLEASYPTARVLTAWPASDELTRPWLGYATRPIPVVRIEDFSLEEVLSAADFRSHFEVALVFSTKYEPPHSLLERLMLGHWKKWEDLKRRFFGYHRDLPPEVAAQILGGHIVFAEERKGQWVAVIEMDQSQVQNASLRTVLIRQSRPRACF